MRGWIAGVVTVPLLMMLANTVRAAEPTAGPAVCMTYAGTGGFGDNDEEAYKLLNVKRSAPVVEAWMNGQIAAGRVNFVSTPVFTNAGVLCAW